MITRVRSLIFIVWVYGSMALWSLVFAPFLLLPPQFSMFVVHGWARTVIWGAYFIVGIKVEFRGRRYCPEGAALVVGKHLSMIDTIAPFLVLKNACYVFKKELMYLPFIGWYAFRANMVPVKREDGAKALKAMSKACVQRLEQGRQIIIFPEGTRSEIDDLDPSYKPGIAAIYRDISVPVYLMATNSGKYWPAHGIDRNPGTVVFEFIEPIPAGLSRGAMMADMKTRLEETSQKLLKES